MTNNTIIEQLIVPRLLAYDITDMTMIPLMRWDLRARYCETICTVLCPQEKEADILYSPAWDIHDQSEWLLSDDETASHGQDAPSRLRLPRGYQVLTMWMPDEVIPDQIPYIDPRFVQRYGLQQDSGRHCYTIRGSNPQRPVVRWSHPTHSIEIHTVLLLEWLEYTGQIAAWHWDMMAYFDASVDVWPADQRMDKRRTAASHVEASIDRWSHHRLPAVQSKLLAYGKRVIKGRDWATLKQQRNNKGGMS